jgi:hypothetical protein
MIWLIYLFSTQFTYEDAIMTAHQPVFIKKYSPDLQAREPKAGKYCDSEE